MAADPVNIDLSVLLQREVQKFRAQLVTLLDKCNAYGAGESTMVEFRNCEERMHRIKSALDMAAKGGPVTWMNYIDGAPEGGGTDDQPCA